MTQPNEGILKLSLYKDEENLYPGSKTADLDIYVRELLWRIPDECDAYRYEWPRRDDVEIPPTPPRYGTGGGGEGGDIVQLIITYLTSDSAVVIALIGAIAAVAKSFLEREKDNEINIEIGDRKFSRKGPITLDIEEMIDALFPELSGKPVQPVPSKLERLGPQAKLTIKTEIEIENHREEPPGEWFQLGK